jgi:CHAD domain-containing protein
VLEPLLAGTARAAIAAVREVQDRLGLLQDLAVLRELCKEVVPDAPELAEHLERVRRHEHAELLRPPGLDRGLLEELRALAGTSERTAAHEAGA